MTREEKVSQISRDLYDALSQLTRQLRELDNTLTLLAEVNRQIDALNRAIEGG